MKNIKDELQHIILGDEPIGRASQLKKTQSFLRANAGTSFKAEKQQQLKSEETTAIVTFAKKENLFYEPVIHDADFFSEGAEQKVYRLGDAHVLKINAGIFYETWLDYFNSLLIHNYFFPLTAYTFLGFKQINGELNAVVKQEYIIGPDPTNLDLVKQYLRYNGFQNKRNNDFYNDELGLILEDLHDENVLSSDGIFFFIDTVFYLTKQFYQKST
ncbi:hypothetical protein [Mucilaginibacter celer]|uniref:Uncharacterized protein n=1 Tax=Mucilaginibacter celer TaxID=2305508 RepID=A0A494W1N6_9SPHI|nr:hypothetical protein [Mucilaginibacter celer]AYL97415.1 hypothetical protein HYN43_019825 [Mucilaginibacter celer]